MASVRYLYKYRVCCRLMSCVPSFGWILVKSNVRTIRFCRHIDVVHNLFKAALKTFYAFSTNIDYACSLFHFWWLHTQIIVFSMFITSIEWIKSMNSFSTISLALTIHQTTSNICIHMLLFAVTLSYFSFFFPVFFFFVSQFFSLLLF